MTLAQWIVLGLIFALCAAVCVAVDRMKKRGEIFPGGL